MKVSDKIKMRERERANRIKKSKKKKTWGDDKSNTKRGLEGCRGGGVDGARLD